MRYRNDKMDSETSVDVSKGVLDFSRQLHKVKAYFVWVLCLN